MSNSRKFFKDGGSFGTLYPNLISAIILVYINQREQKKKNPGQPTPAQAVKGRWPPRTFFLFASGVSGGMGTPRVTSQKIAGSVTATLHYQLTMPCQLLWFG